MWFTLNAEILLWIQVWPGAQADQVVCSCQARIPHPIGLTWQFLYIQMGYESQESMEAQNEAIFLSPGGWRILIKCFISGVQHLPSWSGTPPWSLGALFVVPANRAKRIQGSTMGPWGIGEMGDWITFDIFIPVRPMVQKYQLRCFFCCPSCWRPGPAKFWCIDPHLSFSWVLWVLCFGPTDISSDFCESWNRYEIQIEQSQMFFFGAP